MSKYTRPGVWEELKKTWTTCKTSIEGEMACDSLKGPDHPDCHRLFLRNEDCFQRVLCTERWKEALECVNSKSPEACEAHIKRSRACKDSIFYNLLNPGLREYLTTVAKTNVDCEPHVIRHQRCVSVLGSSDQECLDREIIVSECYYSKTVPRDLWQNWKECKKLAGDDAPEVCTTELEEIRIANHKRAENICKNVGLQKTAAAPTVNIGTPAPSIGGFGGPEGTLDLLTKLYYGSHYGSIFKDYDPRYIDLWEEKKRQEVNKKS